MSHAGFLEAPIFPSTTLPPAKWCNTSNKEAIGRSACFLTVHLSTQHSWHASALFLTLYQLGGYYRCIQWWASWGIICSEQKAKVRERGAAEICPLHCSQIIWAFFSSSLSSSFYPRLTHILFLSFSPSASKWHLSADCSSDWFACVWPPSFSRAIHRQCWSRMPGS